MRFTLFEFRYIIDALHQTKLANGGCFSGCMFVDFNDKHDRGLNEKRMYF